ALPAGVACPNPNTLSRNAHANTHPSASRAAAHTYRAADDSVSGTGRTTRINVSRPTWVLCSETVIASHLPSHRRSLHLRLNPHSHRRRRTVRRTINGTK